jgi:uncharacterized protein YecE (DUF72 family)
VGIAGWNNPPDQRNERASQESHLAYYGSRFSCVEINSSFYKSHRAATYKRWRDETPAQFRFSVKMPRSVTHEARLRRAAREVSQFYEEIALLRPKLRAVLVQLPPTLEFSVRATRTFFHAVPQIKGTMITCEPRHASWFSAAADAVLRELKVSRVAADPPRCPGAGDAGGGRGFEYFRWHGTPCLYYSKYSDAQLQAFATQVRGSKAKEIWCIFDNTARYAAWNDALQFRRLIGRERIREGTDTDRRSRSLSAVDFT